MSFLKFERMITPIFIQILFWVGCIGSIISGLSFIGFGIIADSGGFLQVMMGLGIIFIGPLAVRVYCEMLIVIFKMHGSLLDIRNSVSDRPNPRPIETEEEAL